MDDFWNNILRYPRFFITSLIGLIFVILDPFKQLLKIKKLRIILPIGIGLLVLIIYNILKNMTGL